MIPSSSCPPWLHDIRPNPPEFTSASRSYTTAWDTIVLDNEERRLDRWIANDPTLPEVVEAAKNATEGVSPLVQAFVNLAPKPQQIIPDKNKSRMSSLLRALQEPVNLLEIQAALDRIEIFLGKMKWSMTLHEFLAEIRTLRETIEKGLTNRHLYYYPEAKCLYVLKFEDDWRDISAAFKGVRTEAIAATDCYALGHNTASVFHSMRAAEYGLRALAKERRIKLKRNKPLEWGTWQDILSALRGEEEFIAKNKKAGAAKDRALAFYSGAHSDLMAFKDEYRNVVMHVRSEYDELQALRALTRVQEFMQRIAQKLSDKNYRIRWGVR